MSNTPPPRRYLTREEMSVGQTLAHLQTGEQIENPEYAQARADALAAAGFEPEDADDLANKSPEDMTVEEIYHHNKQQRQQQR